MKRMGDLYASAFSVIAWLGPEIERSADFFKAINEMELKDPTEFDNELIQLVTHRMLNFPDSAWQTLEYFCTLSYWKRTWIIQEISLSSIASDALWGDQTCPVFSTFSILYTLHNSPAVVEKLISLSIETFVPLDVEQLMAFGVEKLLALDIKSDLPVRPNDPLLRRARHVFNIAELHKFVPFEVVVRDAWMLFEVLQYSQQSDDRDKVYAILYLISNSISDLTSPDYTLPVVDVYVQFSEALIRSAGRLDVVLSMYLPARSDR